MRNQFFTESVLITLISLPLAILLAWIAIPYASELFNTKLEIINTNIGIYILVFIVVTLFIGFASGGYTAGYLSRLKVISILKNSTRSGSKKPVFQSLLIITELIIFCSFVTSALIIRSQYKHFMTLSPGYHTDDVFVINIGRGFNAYEPFLNFINSNPEVVLAAGGMDDLPMRGSMSNMIPNFKDQENKIRVEGMAVDYNYLETMGINLLQGRSFSKDFGSDLENSIMINETAAKKLSIDDPIDKNLLGKSIIGVVKDFNLHSLHSDIPPMFIEMTNKYLHNIVVRYKPGTFNTLIEKLQVEWKKLDTGRSLPFYTIEQVKNDIYASEKRLFTIVSLSALFTLIISMFGLFGLTLFISKSRTKEVGIRKVLGSSEQAIVLSFLRTNIISAVASAVIFIPSTFFIMSTWLNNYAYKVSVNMWYFLVSLGVASVVIILTVTYQAIKASRANPVEVLRYE